MLDRPVNSKVNISMMMFNKKLYGKMPFAEGGCFGCWEINMTWEDEMPGRVRHNLSDTIQFGSEGFLVLVEVEGEVMYGCTVNKNDSIF